MASAAPWDEVLAHLRALDPQVRVITCEDESSPDKTLAVVRVEEVCYFTTDSAVTRDPEEGDGGTKPQEKPKRYAVMLVTDQGKRLFTNTPLGEIERGLVDRPWVLRSSKAYLVNLLKITQSRVAKRGRDLKFHGSDDWVLGAVGEKAYLEAFQARFITNV